MSAVWSPEELANRFAPYIEELHEFFSFHRMSFGTAADIGTLAERTETPGAFRDELNSLVRSIILREGGSVPQTELLEIVAIAAGGISVNPTAPDLQQAMRKLLSFVGTVTRRPWNEPPSENGRLEAAETAEQSEAGIDDAAIKQPEADAEEAPESLRRQAALHHGVRSEQAPHSAPHSAPRSAPRHSTPYSAAQQHHGHLNNVVPFPVRGDRQRWGHERFESPHHESRTIDGPDDLPTDIDPNPAQAFASALGARHLAAGKSAKAKSEGAAAAADPSQTAGQTAAQPQNGTATATASSGLPAQTDDRSAQPDGAHSTTPPQSANSAVGESAKTALAEEALAHHFGLMERHPASAAHGFTAHASAAHAPLDSEEFAREQEEADSDPFFAEPPPPAWRNGRNGLIAGGAALALVIAVVLSMHSHRAADTAQQADPVQTVPPTGSAGIAATAANSGTALTTVTNANGAVSPKARAKPSPYTNDEGDADSAPPRRIRGEEELIAEPYTSQSLHPAVQRISATQQVSTAQQVSSVQPASGATASVAPGTTIASNSPPSIPPSSSGQSGSASGPPISSGFAARSGAPIYRPSAERSYRESDAALVGDLPERPAGTALEDHPRYLDVSSGVMAGNLISAPMPDYPMLAKLAHVHGKVILQAVIGKDGSVSAAKVLSGNRLLRGAAVDAVRLWRYKPYMQQGKPVDVSTIVTVDFHNSPDS